MGLKKYGKVTHKLTKDLTELVLDTVKSGNNKVFAVYRMPQETIIQELSPFENQKMLRYGYKKLIDTSGINELVGKQPKLQFKTGLEAYLYKLIRREEFRIAQASNKETTVK